MSLDRNELIVRAEKEKRDPEGKKLGPEACAFGNEIGERVKPMREQWSDAVAKAGLKGLQMRDLRHEAGPRFIEAGMPIRGEFSRTLAETNGPIRTSVWCGSGDLNPDWIAPTSS